MSIDELLAELEGPVKSLRAMREAAATIRALREALEPFAKASAIRLCGGDYWTAEKTIQGTDIAFYITFGDLGRASAALEASHGRVG